MTFNEILSQNEYKEDESNKLTFNSPVSSDDEKLVQIFKHSLSNNDLVDSAS